MGIPGFSAPPVKGENFAFRDFMKNSFALFKLPIVLRKVRKASRAWEDSTADLVKTVEMDCPELRASVALRWDLLCHVAIRTFKIVFLMAGPAWPSRCWIKHKYCCQRRAKGWTWRIRPRWIARAERWTGKRLFKSCKRFHNVMTWVGLRWHWWTTRTRWSKGWKGRLRSKRLWRPSWTSRTTRYYENWKF